MTKRIPQVNSLIKQELGKIFLEELEWPEGVLVTIIQVETTRDLREARVWISVLPIDKSQAVLKVLYGNAKNLQRILHGRLVMKPLPKLRFDLDTTEEKAGKMDKLLGELS
ncbi:ribosome-binding factor A [Patescibacteria group bacterium]|nr:ribosome-binding factor A [Patescibacteria group bacterium]MBU4512319.1 ribosome-binding factor A [Patescibacteria group bacterium]MCG2693316.1 ribosome-binding factor A [Candidatus Parcubacteria bacterium]